MKQHEIETSNGIYGVNVSGDTYEYHRMRFFTELGMTKNPNEYSRKYVDEATERTDITAYAPEISYAFDKYRSDSVLDDIIRITNEEKLGSDAVRQIIWVDALYAFYHAEQLAYHDDEAGEMQAETPQRKSLLFDWKFDAKFVLGDFRHCYQIDLITIEYLHWFEFCALFDALPEDARCMKRIAYRSADLNQIKDQNEKKRIRKLKRAVAIPHIMTDEEIGAEFAF